MARIRTVKPEFWTDSKVVRLSPLARLLFIGSWNYADDHGCIKDDALQLKLRVLPTDDVSADELVAEIMAEGLFRAARSADGETFWYVAGFDKHQKIDKRAKPTYGERDTWEFVESPPIPPTPADSRPTHTTEGRKEGREGGERKGKDSPTVPPTSGGALVPVAEVETVNQRAQRLTKVYTDEVPLSRFPAVMGIVKQAINARKTDMEITSALLRLAAEGRTVTTETLRLEIEGLPAARQGGSLRKQEGDRILREAWEDAS